MTSLSYRVRTFWKDNKALAAIEFAMVLPFMLLLYVGGIELANGMAINVKVTAAAHSVADMVSQNTQVSTPVADHPRRVDRSCAIPDDQRHLAHHGGRYEVSTDSNAMPPYSGTSRTTERTSGRADRSVNGSHCPPRSPDRKLQCLLHPGRSCLRLHAQSRHDQRHPDAQRQLLPVSAVFDEQPCNADFPYFDVKLTTATNCTCIQHLQQRSIVG